MTRAMYMSKLYAPTLKEDPADAELASHRLLLRAGMIRKEAAGLYSYLPLAWRSIRKIENIVRDEMDAAGAQELISSVFQALGNGVFSLTVSVCRQLVVLIPAAWLLSHTGEVNMVWWSFIIAEVVSLTLSLIFMARINRTVIVPLYEEQDAAV